MIIKEWSIVSKLGSETTHKSDAVKPVSRENFRNFDLEPGLKTDIFQSEKTANPFQHAVLLLCYQ